MDNKVMNNVKNRKKSRLTSAFGAVLFVFFLTAGYANPIYFIPAGVVLTPLIAYSAVYELLGITLVALLALYFKGGFSADSLLAALFLFPALLSGLVIRKTDGFKKAIVAGALGFTSLCLTGIMTATYSAYGSFSGQNAVKYLEERMANAIRSSAELLKEIGQSDLAATFSDKNLIASTSALMAAALPAIIMALGMVLTFVYVASCRKSVVSFGKTSNMQDSSTFMVSKTGAILFVLCQFYSAANSNTSLAFLYTCVSISILLTPAFAYEGYGVVLNRLHAKNRPGVLIIIALVAIFLTIYTQFTFIYILAFTGAFDAVFDLRHLNRGKADAGNG